MCKNFVSIWFTLHTTGHDTKPVVDDDKLVQPHKRLKLPVLELEDRETSPPFTSQRWVSTSDVLRACQIYILLGGTNLKVDSIEVHLQILLVFS